MPINYNQLREFLTAIAQTNITQLTIKEGDFELSMSKEVKTSVAYTPPPSLPPTVKVEETTTTTDKQPLPPPETPSVPPSSGNWVDITSPMVGTFYGAPAPGEPSFASVGDRLSVGQVVCIIEAMKLMNEIETEVAGQVMEILVENGEPVEYGQILMRIEPG